MNAHEKGQMSERSKETVLKTVEGQPSASSNLALSANQGSGSNPGALFFYAMVAALGYLCPRGYGLLCASAFLVLRVTASGCFLGFVTVAVCECH